MSRSTFVLAVSSVIVFFGCGTQPIGRVAVPGTTIVIPVPANYYPGYGMRIGIDPATAPAYSATHPYEDPQRGELLFKLVKVDVEPEEEYGYLPRRWVVRVAVDEAAPNSRDPGDWVSAQPGQAVALVDIPVDVDDGEYEVRVERWRRDPTSPTNAFVQVTTEITYTIPFGGGTFTVPWQGWGTGDPEAGVPLKIQGPAVDPPEFADDVGWDEWFGSYSSSTSFAPSTLRDYVPDATFTIAAFALPSTFPAAWQAEYDYPKDRIKILGVKLFRDGASNAIVRYQADDPNATVSCGAAAGRLKIQMLDPDKRALGVRVIYGLRNFEDTCGQRAVPTADFDLVANTFRAFDQSGAPMTLSDPVILDEDR